MMQASTREATAGEQEWTGLLRELAQTLEVMAKDRRGLAAGQLLRWLDHRATDQARGYFLGHMGGRPADLTALLVAMRSSEEEPCVLDRDTPEHAWTLVVWDRVCAFVACHEGSSEHQGRPLTVDPPTVMLFSRPLPENTPSPVHTSEVEEAERTPKRRMVRVEVSSSSMDAPRTSASVMVPLNETDGAEVHMTMTVLEHNASPATTVARPTTGGLALPNPAPHGLGRLGLSETDYRSLWTNWRTGALSVAEIRRCHGPVVAQFVQDTWGRLPREAYLDLPPEGAEGPAGDEALLFQTLLLPILTQAMPSSTAPEPAVPEDFFELGKKVIQYMEQQGADRVVVATVLQMLSWDRHEEDYDIMLETFLLNLDLPIEADCDREDEADPHHRDVMVWLEQELWLQYVDVMEEEAGWETDRVMDLRGRCTVSEPDCRVWREWATATTRHQTRQRSRSRSPRRGQDETSLMEKPDQRTVEPKRRPTAASGSGSSRPSDAAEPRLRERSRSTRPTAGDGERPSLQRRGPRRCTEEVRRLRPLERRPARRPEERDRPMDVNDATLWWLRLLGLRGSEDEDISRVLPLQGHEDRLWELRDIPSTDLIAIMMGLLRVTAMLWVECCQLVYNHPHLAPDVEVTVEEDDATVWMQLPGRGASEPVAASTSTQACPVELEVTQQSQWDTNGTTAGVQHEQIVDLDTLLEDEDEARSLRSAEQAERSAQEDARDRELANQSRLDEALFREHQAAVYRDWETWVYQTAGSDPPLRLRLNVAARQGAQRAEATTWLPLARNHPIHLQLELREEGSPEAPGQQEQVTHLRRPAGESGPIHTDLEVQDLYSEWRQRRISDTAVIQQVGEEMFVVFLAQQQADGEDEPSARVQAATGAHEGPGDEGNGGRKRRAPLTWDVGEDGVRESGMDES